MNRFHLFLGALVVVTMGTYVVATNYGVLVQPAYGAVHNQAAATTDEQFKADVLSLLRSINDNTAAIAKAAAEPVPEQPATQPPGGVANKLQLVRAMANDCNSCHGQKTNDQGGGFQLFSAEGNFVRLSKTQMAEVERRLKAPADHQDAMPPKKFIASGKSKGSYTPESIAAFMELLGTKPAPAGGAGG